MPRETEPSGRSRDRDERTPATGASAALPSLVLTDELREALLPWVDLAEVGPVGLRSWLLSVLPLLPQPGAGDHVLDRDVSRGDAEERLERLAHALAECASDRARKNFQASEYFRENRVLARRVKALEAIARTSAQASGGPTGARTDPEADAAVERYLPRGKR